MAIGAHESGGGFGKSAGVKAGRGLAVIAVALLVGGLLMVKGLDENDSVAIDASDSATVPEDGTSSAGGSQDGDDASTGATDADGGSVRDDGEEPSADTTDPVADTPATARTPAEVLVLVLNGTDGIKGIAGRGTAKLTESGYATTEAGDAKSSGPSVILYNEGFQLEAEAIAAVFEISAELAVPFDPATSPTDETKDANVIVRIGNDNIIQI